MDSTELAAALVLSTRDEWRIDWLPTWIDEHVFRCLDDERLVEVQYQHWQNTTALRGEMPQTYATARPRGWFSPMGAKFEAGGWSSIVTQARGPRPDLRDERIFSSAPGSASTDYFVRLGETGQVKLTKLRRDPTWPDREARFRDALADALRPFRRMLEADADFPLGVAHWRALQSIGELAAQAGFAYAPFCLRQFNGVLRASTAAPVRSRLPGFDDPAIEGDIRIRTIQVADRPCSPPLGSIRDDMASDLDVWLVELASRRTPAVQLGGSKRLAGSPELTPAVRKAGSAWEHVCSARPDLLPDSPKATAEQWRWLKENTPEGYEVPSEASWLRYVRDYIRLSGEARSARRAGRPRGRSIVKPDEI